MLRLDGIRVSYGDQAVLPGVDLTVKHDEILCLLGPSGCGKTTLLRAIAGLEPIVSGQIWLDDGVITAQPVHKRDFGLMFQDFALFPHLNVLENVRFGLRMRGHTDHQRALEVLSLVGLAGYAERDVTQLSGGERQRVALARSLAPSPRLLMLDEPLGSLDASLRERLLLDLRRIIKTAGLTAIYVTHDQQEAFAIADRVAVMDAGRIVQVAAPEHLYHRPLTPFVARFMGLENVIPVDSRQGQKAQTPLGCFALPVDAPDGDDLLLHTDGLYLHPQGRINGQVTERVFSGAYYRLRAQCGDWLLQWRMPATHGGMAPLPEPGDQVRLDVRPEALWTLVRHDAHN